MNIWYVEVEVSDVWAETQAGFLFYLLFYIHRHWNQSKEDNTKA